MGGGGTNTIQSAEPYDEQMPYVRDIFRNAQVLSREDIPYYPGQTYAESNPLHDLGFSSRLGTANQYGNMTDAAGRNVFSLANQAANDARTASTPTVDPSGRLRQNLTGAVDINPYNRAAEAMTNQMTRAVDAQVGSNDQTAAMMGQSGSSRHGVAEGILRSNANSQLQDAMATMYLGAHEGAQDRAAQGVDQAVDLYSQGALADSTRMNTAQSLFGSVPQFGEANLGFGRVPLEAGDFYRSEQQTAIEDAINRYNYETQQPWNNLSRYSQLIWGAPGGQNTETTTTGSTSAIGSMAGGAMAGAQAGAATGMSAGGGWGALIGAALGYLSSR